MQLYNLSKLLGTVRCFGWLSFTIWTTKWKSRRTYEIPLSNKQSYSH